MSLKELSEFERESALRAACDIYAIDLPVGNKYTVCISCNKKKIAKVGARVRCLHVPCVLDNEQGNDAADIYMILGNMSASEAYRAVMESLGKEVKGEAKPITKQEILAREQKIKEREEKTRIAMEQAEKDLERSRAFVKLKQSTAKDIRDPDASRQWAIEYLKNVRKLELDTLISYGFRFSTIGATGTKETAVVPHAIIVKGVNSDNTISIKQLNKNREPKKSENWTEFGACLLGAREIMRMEKLGKSAFEYYKKQPIYVVEGEICALTLWQNGLQAISCGGSNATGISKWLKENVSNRNIVLLMDNDEAGKKLETQIIDLLRQHGMNVRVAKMPEGYKDINDAHVAGVNVADYFNSAGVDVEPYTEAAQDDAEFQNLIDSITCSEEAMEYAENNQPSQPSSNYGDKYSIIGQYEDWEQWTIRNRQRNAIPTGFAELDKVLNGGMYAGLYVIGAGTSMGKTALALNVVAKIVESGQSVMYFSTEVSRRDVISRMHAIKSGEFSSGKDGIGAASKSAWDKGYPLDNQCKGSIVPQVQTWFADNGRKMMVIDKGDTEVNEGMERKLSTAQISQMVKEYIRETGDRPIVFVDHLHQLAARDARQSDKQKVESNTADLLTIAQECDTPVVMVSIINRDAYWEPITFKAFKESGSIEYDCHVVLGVQPRGIENVGATITMPTGKDGRPSEAQIKEARKKLVDDTMKEEEVRKLEMVVLKNRDGRTGAKIPINMYSRYGWVKPVNVT